MDVIKINRIYRELLTRGLKEITPNKVKNALNGDITSLSDEEKNHFKDIIGEMINSLQLVNSKL